MKIHIALLIILFTFLGCKQKPTTDIPIENITSEVVFENQDMRSDLLSMSKGRYRNNIVSNLYEEALERNKTLYDLNQAIQQSYSIKSDTLESYLEYSAIIESYMLDKESYIHQIKDTILRKIVIESFNDMKGVHDKRVSDYLKKKNILEEKTMILQDRLILMKLSITQAMMTKFQENEMPDISSLETIIKEQDKLISETQQFITIEK